jgi:hypothetical protein
MIHKTGKPNRRKSDTGAHELVSYGKVNQLAKDQAYDVGFVNDLDACRSQMTI